ncbi:MAG: glycosyltransferase [Verrucomicrobia bacterium]|nr:glycosyltransferase [Verrucomicrobiota bacterium]
MSAEADSPIFSIIVPLTDENVHLLPFTMDSIAEQTLNSYEVIVIDAQTKEHSLCVFDAYRSHITRIYTALDRNLSAMLNKGVDLSRGSYLHFMQPGEFYISRNAFRFLKNFIDQNPSPDLVYTGCVLRHSLAPPQQLFKQIQEEDLKGAKVPQGLQAYWYKRDAVVLCGKFRTRYQIQGGFDLLCRFYRIPTLRKVFMRRILTDYEYRLPRAKWIIRQFFETLIILFRHFSLSKAALFWVGQNNLRFFRWWGRSVKAAFWKGGPVD